MIDSAHNNDKHITGASPVDLDSSEVYVQIENKEDPFLDKPYEIKSWDFFCWRDPEDDRAVYLNWWKILSIPFFVGSGLLATFSLVQADKDVKWESIPIAEFIFGGIFGLLGFCLCCCGIKRHGC